MADQEGVAASVICGEKNRGFYGRYGLCEEINGGKDGVMLFRMPRAGW